jgi:hypothetical protein
MGSRAINLQLEENPFIDIYHARTSRTRLYSRDEQYKSPRASAVRALSFKSTAAVTTTLYTNAKGKSQGWEDGTSKQENEQTREDNVRTQ